MLALFFLPENKGFFRESKTETQIGHIISGSSHSKENKVPVTHKCRERALKRHLNKGASL